MTPTASRIGSRSRPRTPVPSSASTTTPALSIPWPRMFTSRATGAWIFWTRAMPSSCFQLRAASAVPGFSLAPTRTAIEAIPHPARTRAATNPSPPLLPGPGEDQHGPVEPVVVLEQCPRRRRDGRAGVLHQLPAGRPEPPAPCDRGRSSPRPRWRPEPRCPPSAARARRGWRWPASGRRRAGGRIGSARREGYRAGAVPRHAPSALRRLVRAPLHPPGYCPVESVREPRLEARRRLADLEQPVARQGEHRRAHRARPVLPDRARRTRSSPSASRARSRIRPRSQRFVDSKAGSGRRGAAPGPPTTTAGRTPAA